MDKKTKAKLESIVTAGYDARNKLQAVEARAKSRSMRKRIGCYEKYSNSYGSGARWWLYRKITGVEDGMFICFEFQTCEHGKTEIEIGKRGFSGSDYMPITKKEFDAAYAKIKKLLTP